MIAYRLALLLVILVVFSSQQAIALHASPRARPGLGYAVSVALLAACVEFSTLILGRRLFRPAADEPRLSARAVLAIATLMLGANLASKFAVGFAAVVPKAHNLRRVSFVLVPWLACLGLVRRRGSSPMIIGLGLGFLVLAVRVLGLVVTPFDRLHGDMLQTIDRSLDLLLQGRYPYVNFPPPMPYWPGLFLSYVPPKLAGVDLRWTNLALDSLLAVLCVLSVPGALGSRRVGANVPAIELEQIALPFMLLWPPIVHTSIQIHYSPCLLAAAVLARTLVHARPIDQSLALAFALATNQSLLPFAPLIGLWWCRRLGAGRAGRLMLTTGLVLFGVLAPFLAWHPRAFFDVTLGSIGPLPREFMYGRLTLRPVLEDISPILPSLASAVVGLMACAAVLRVRTARGLVAVLAVTYLLLIYLLVRTFSHYTLPALVMITACPTAFPRSASGAPDAPPGPGRRV